MSDEKFNAPEVIEPKGRAMKEVMAMEMTGDVRAIVPRTIDEAFRLAQYVVAAGLAPDSYNNDPKAIVIGIMKAMEIGVPPITGLSQIAIIKGRPTVWGDLAIALAQRTGTVEWVQDEDIGEPPLGELVTWPDSYGVRYRIKRREQEKPYIGEFTVGDARRAKLWLNSKKAPWMDYPRRMLYNRARAFALRDGFADALAGLSIREEVEDMPAERKPVTDTSFLDTPALAATSPHPPADSPVVPTPDDTAEGKAEAPDMVADDLAGHLEALPAVRDLAHLEQLDAEVREFLKEADRVDLLPRWNGAKLERERALRGRK